MHKHPQSNRSKTCLPPCTKFSSPDIIQRSKKGHQKGVFYKEEKQKCASVPPTIMFHNANISKKALL